MVEKKWNFRANGAEITNRIKAHKKKLVALSVKRFTDSELKSILDKHEQHVTWWTKGPDIKGVEERLKMSVELMDLRGADFRKRNLRGAIFTECRFDGADFTGAQLKYVCFSGCDLRGAKGIRSTVLDQGTYLGGLNLLPPHLKSSLRNRMRRVRYLLDHEP